MAEAAGTGQAVGLGRAYRRLWLASGMANLSDGIRLAVLPLLAAQLTSHPATIGGLLSATMLPWLLFALPVGAMVDRHGDRNLLGGANLARAATVGVLALALVTGWVSIPLLYLAGFVLGVAEVVVDTATQTLMPTIVPAQWRDAANGRLLSVEMVANNFVGPLTGTALFALSAAAPLLVSAPILAVAALLAWHLRRPGEPAGGHTARTSIRAEIAQGLRWLAGHRLLRALAVSAGLGNLLLAGATSTLVLLARDTFGLGPLGYGLLLTSTAAGSVISGLAAGRGRTSAHPIVVFRLGVCALSLACLGLALSPNGLVAGVALALAAGAVVALSVITLTLRQSLVPGPLLGRVNSVYRLVAWGSTPVGAAAGGVAADAYGLRAPAAIAAALLLVLLLATLRVVTAGTIDRARAARGRPAQGGPRETDLGGANLPDGAGTARRPE